MPDCTELTKAIKKAAIEAMEAGKPVNICFGTVISAAPLRISVDQKMALGEKQLLLTKNVTDHSVRATIEWSTEENSFDSHRHEIIGMKEITLHNGLAAGDTVILIRQQSGQQYVVLDRIGT